jgi:hypothetical protein
VAAGGGDLERAFGSLLAFDVGQLGIVRRALGKARERRAQHLRAIEVVDQREQAGASQDLDVAAEPSGLAAARSRTDQAELARRRGDRCGQHAGDP